jgi:hypothetical protein
VEGGGPWWLDDVEALNREAPESFFIPPAAKRRSLKAGDRVKLIFRFVPAVRGIDGERMWVAVTAVDAGRYEGRLENQPEYLTSLAYGAEIGFGPEHVAAYEWTPEELGYDPELGAWVRRESSVPHGERPTRASMRPADLRAAEGDSGWILGRGDESGREYTSEKVFGWAALGWLTDLFPELEPVFQAGEGDWRWDDAAGDYRRVS